MVCCQDSSIVKYDQDSLTQVLLVKSAQTLKKGVISDEILSNLSKSPGFESLLPETLDTALVLTDPHTFSVFQCFP